MATETSTTPAADQMRWKLEALKILPAHLKVLRIYLNWALDEAREAGKKAADENLKHIAATAYDRGYKEGWSRIKTVHVEDFAPDQVVKDYGRSPSGR